MTWKTIFHTAENRMEHDFGGGNTVVVDFNHNMAYKLRNGDVKDSFSVAGMLLETFTQILENIAKSI